jgi:hypothetical protein
VALLRSQNQELVRVAKAAAMSEEKKDAMLEELKLGVKEERHRVGREKEEVAKDRRQLDEYKRIKEEEYMAIKRQLDDKVHEISGLVQKLDVSER